MFDEVKVKFNYRLLEEKPTGEETYEKEIGEVFSEYSNVWNNDHDPDTNRLSKSIHSFLIRKNRSVKGVEYPFWIDEVDEEFSTKVEGYLTQAEPRLNEHGLYIVPSHIRRFVFVRDLNRIVGYIFFQQMTSEKLLVTKGCDLLHTLVEENLYNLFTQPVPHMINRLLFNNRSRQVVSAVKRTKLREEIKDPKAFWPFLERTPKEIYTDFVASDASVLILYGSPGLGKTQFLNELLRLRESSERDYLADTKEVLEADSLVSFIHDMKEGAWFITEDAMSMVEKRTSGNSQMVGLLNATEGITSGKVKFIISTNMTNLNEVDEALIRPGRVFDILKFERITGVQGNAARLSIGKPAVEVDPTKKYSLAEILNWEDYIRFEKLKSRVGF